MKIKQQLEEELQKVKVLEGKIAELMEQQLAETCRLLEEAKQLSGRPLRYNDLYDGGVLSKHVDAFTLFPTVEQNDAFLDLLNYADGSEGSFPVGDGLLENLRPYSKVSRAERSGVVDAPTLGDEDYGFIDCRDKQRKDE